MDRNLNNSWLVTDISADLARPSGPSYELTVDRQKFLKTRLQTERSIAVQNSEYFLPAERVGELAAQLQDGDFVNVVSTRNGGYWVSHVGLVATGPDGERRFLHSSEPQVCEESFGAFVARAREREERNAREGKNGQKLAGFKFLRLNDNIVVPPAAPQPRPGFASAN